MLIKRVRPWILPEKAATPKAVYLNRRSILKQMGFLGLGLSLPGCFLSVDGKASPTEPDDAGVSDSGGAEDIFSAERNSKYAVPERSVTPESVATQFNNFYEFTTAKDQVWQLVGSFETEPWTIEVAGLVENPRTIDIEQLLSDLPTEERLYRFRCVEAWAATIPWTGIPFAELVKYLKPLSSAKYVLMQSANRPKQMPGIAQRPNDPWPYHEGLRMDEAMNELTIMAVGVYGKPLPAQNGAPLRLITPWKYGYKGIKSIVRIEFVEEEPKTFWNTLGPNEYDFLANVNPDVPHPRWSQATERLIDNGEVVPTKIYNGYEEFVAHMYRS